VAVDLGTMYRATLLDVRGMDGNPLAPASLTYTVTPPDQSVVAPITPTEDVGTDGTVNYYADYLTLQEGLHRGQWAGTVPNVTRTDYFNVTGYRAMVGLDEVKDHLGIHDTSEDDKLRQVIAGATGLVEQKVGTCVQRTVTDEWIPGREREIVRLMAAPLPTAASVTSIRSVYSGGPSWAAADLLVNPGLGTCWTANMMGFYYGPWLATYAAGRRVIEPAIILGCQEVIWDLWAIKRGVDYDSDEPTLSEVASFESTLAIPQNYRMPIRALEFLDPYTMPGFA
jgi:Phage gp6-like head-tail connector protein